MTTEAVKKNWEIVVVVDSDVDGGDEMWMILFVYLVGRGVILPSVFSSFLCSNSFLFRCLFFLVTVHREKKTQ